MSSGTHAVRHAEYHGRSLTCGGCHVGKSNVTTQRPYCKVRQMPDGLKVFQLGFKLVHRCFQPYLSLGRIHWRTTQISCQTTEMCALIIEHCFKSLQIRNISTQKCIAGRGTTLNLFLILSFII